MKFIVGKKKQMSQIFQEDGRVVPVTIIEAGPCVVTQVKSNETDGYKAVQVGFGDLKKVTKTVAGHQKGLTPKKVIKEFRITDDTQVERGQEITTKVFEEGDKLRVTGKSKGKGFAGVVKRYGFAGQSTSHGVKDQVRMPGSSGATGPAHVFKGKKNPGRMGGGQVTVANLELIKKDDDNNLLYVKGAVPGAMNSLIFLAGEGIMDFSQPEPVVEEATEEVTVEDTSSEAVKEEQSEVEVKEEAKTAEDQTSPEASTNEEKEEATK